MSVLNFDQAELDPAQSEEAGGDDITIFWRGHEAPCFQIVRCCGAMLSCTLLLHMMVCACAAVVVPFRSDLPLQALTKRPTL